MTKTRLLELLKDNAVIAKLNATLFPVELNETVKNLTAKVVCLTHEEDEASKGWTDHLIGNCTRIQGYRNSKRMAVNGMVKRLCKEKEVGYVDLWDSFVEKEEMYMRDGLHLSGRGLPFLPRDCQGRLPVAWVKYDI